MSGLAYKVALITGASSGIGFATSLLFAKLGASLVVSGRNAAQLDRLVSECRQANKEVKVEAAPADICKEAEAEALVGRAVDRFKRLDVLVNCAGILEPGSIEDTTLEQFDRIMNINTRSLLHLSLLSVPHLIASKGAIVNVSSVNGLRAFPGVVAYNVSKAAVDQLTRCMALDLAPKQVRVNAVNPGVTVTELHKRSGMSEERYAAFLEHSRTTHALGRPGEAREVAEAIAFLADNERSGFVTGHSLPVDGGRHAMCPR